MASLGSLVVSLAMDTAKFSGDVGKAAQQLTRLTAEAGKVGAALGTSIVAGTRLIGGLVKASIDSADEMSKMAVSLAMTTEEVSQLSYAADLAGISQEELGSSLAKLARRAADAAAGGKQASEVFDAMGIKVTDANGAVKSTTDILGDVADKFASYESGVNRTALAQEVFGKSGARLLPFLVQGREGLADLAKEADLLGITLSTKAGLAAEQFNDNLTRLQAAQNGVGRRIAEQLLPTLEALTNRLFDGARNADLFGRAATIAASGVKLLVSAGAIIAGVFDTIGTTLGGVAAALVALFSGRFADAFKIADMTVSDFAGNVRAYAGTINTVWDTAASTVEGKAESLGGKIAAPLVTAEEKAKKAARSIQTEAEKAYEAIEKRLGALKFDVDTQGATDRIKGLLELTRQGATPEQLNRFLELSSAQERYVRQTEAAAEADGKRNAMLSEGASLADSLRTPLEALRAEYGRLDDLQKAGAISAETYARAVLKAQTDFDQATQKTAETTDKFSERAAENIQGFIGDSLQKALEGNFKSIGDSFVQMLNRMVAEAIAANVMRSVFGATGAGGIGNILTGIAGSALQGLFGVTGSGAGGTTTGDFARMDRMDNYGGRAVGGPGLARRSVHGQRAHPLPDRRRVVRADHSRQRRARRPRQQHLYR
jgi:hypothetical protein